MYKSQVEKFVDRCFVKSTKNIKFIKIINYENYDIIGFAEYSDKNVKWKLEFHQSFLTINSRFFIGKIPYEKIENCEAISVRETTGKAEYTKIYDMDYVRTMTDAEICQHYNSQNGVIINFENRQAIILLSTDKIEETDEIINSVCNFLARVIKTRAWEEKNNNGL